jgi:hypothetical protein
MEFEDMTKLKDNYMDLKKTKIQLERSLESTNKQYHKDKTFYTSELKRERAMMLNDKEKRKEHGITNNESWKLKINELTASKEIQIEENLKEREDTIADLEKQIRDMGLDIESLHWDLKINLAFVTEIKGSVI